MSKGAQIALGATGIALLIGWYGATNLETGATYRYYQTLTEFQAASGTEPGDSLRVHGYVVAGSIERDVAGKQVRFAVQNEPPHAGPPQGATLPVIFQSLETPDLFKDGAEVVVEGSVEGGNGTTVFVAQNLLAKCPSKFQAKSPTGAEL